MSPTELSHSEAEQLRAFERQGHDALATSYHAFFSSVTALATNTLLDTVGLHVGTRLLDVATGPGTLAAGAANRGARPVVRRSAGLDADQAGLDRGEELRHVVAPQPAA